MVSLPLLAVLSASSRVQVYDLIVYVQGFNQCCGSGPFFSGSGSYLDMFLMFSKVNNFFMAFSNQIYTSYDT